MDAYFAATHSFDFLNYTIPVLDIFRSCAAYKEREKNESKD
jgi:hypothetical protein